MGNPDLVIIINRGEYNFILKGIEYNGHMYNDIVFKIATERYIDWANGIAKIADKPEELNFMIKKIEIYEIDLPTQ